MNPAAERMFGWAAEEVVGRHASVLMPDPTRGEGPSALPPWLQAG